MTWTGDVRKELQPIADVLFEYESVLSDGYGFYCDRREDFEEVCEKLLLAAREMNR